MSRRDWRRVVGTLRATRSRLAPSVTAADPSGWPLEILADDELEIFERLMGELAERRPLLEHDQQALEALISKLESSSSIPPHQVNP